MACVKGLAVTVVRYLEGREDTREEYSMVRTISAWLGRLGVAAATLLMNPPGAHPDDTLLTIDAGKIRGVIETPGSTVRVFRGIPYARPPVGEFRWRPPQPVPSWDTVKECSTFGPSCPQPAQKIIPGIAGIQSEDCLYLNVWTAAKEGERRPVMVWIHGGGFTIGSGSQRTYDGLHFAEDGAVQVTINYRLGPFGFMAHPALSAGSPDHVSGNYGLLDQIEALRWVRRNISAFGGDPGNVTVFGESAGSVAVGCLIASPLAKGLFHRAIMESGVPANLPHLRTEGKNDSSAESAGVEIAREIGIEDPERATDETAARLRAIPPEKLLASSHPRIGLFGGGRRMGPAIDGYVLPRSPLEIFAAGEGNIVPVLMGSNADEGTLFIQQIPIRMPAGYEVAQKRIFGDYAGRVIQMFPAHTPEEVTPAIARLVTVAAFVAPARRTARALSQHESRVWLYHFTRVSPVLKAHSIGATHGIELFYVFKTIPAGVQEEEADLKVADAMHAAWLRFSESGDPNGKGLPEWPAFSTANDTHFEFGDRLGTGQHLMSDECDLFDEISISRTRGAGIPGE
jgi:para-nitrobenzyl esterase